MRTAFIEHVNLTVTNPERSAELMNRLFGWQVRWSGPARDGGRAVHVGDDKFYLALFAPAEGGEQRHPKGEPLNHVGLVVDDLEGAEQRVIEAGLVPFAHADYDPGRRFYFFDHDGIEFELVSYA
jgi:catechol 2,3-dioxygenase-like lactoylglutathione lyase family enzyme